MRKSFRFTAVVLVVLMLLGVMPLSGAAYGAADNKLMITHLNDFKEGAAIIFTPAKGDTVGGTYTYWTLITFDWDTTDHCYKVTLVQAKSGDKSATVIPKTGFVYGINTGNDYPALYALYLSDPVKYASYKTYADPVKYPNYKTATIVQNNDYAKTLTVGEKAYLYNTDLLNLTMDKNDKLWYSADFVSNSYIKIGTPDTTGTLYDPTTAVIIEKEHPVNITDINTFGSVGGKSIIFTSTYGTDILGSTPAHQYNWWKAVLIEWNDKENSYIVSSNDLSTGNDYKKQLIIPEDGFVVMASLGDADANKTSCDNMGLLIAGTKVHVYGADIKAGTISASAKICPEIDTTLTEYKPALSGTRLAAPVITSMTEERTITANTGFEIKWNAVEGATGYIVNVNDSTNFTDGLLTVKNATVTGTSYTLTSDLLTVGKNYTVSVYAKGTDKISSMLTRKKLSVISQEASTSNLRNKTIVAYGDSLTAAQGLGVEPADIWIQLLRNRFGADIINAGVGGETSAKAKLRFETDVVAKNPDIVLINFGMNDQACGMSSNTPLVSLDTYKANLEYFASTLKAAGADVIFVTPNPVCTAEGFYVPGAYNMNYSSGNLEMFCDTMRQIAIQNGYGLVDLNMECTVREDMTKFVTSGGIHQTVYGHQEYAKYIGDYLAAVYDSKSTTSVQINYVDKNNTAVSPAVTLKGAVGSNVRIPGIEIENLTSTPGMTGYTFTADNGTVTFTFSGNTPDQTIELSDASKSSIDGSFLFLDSDEYTSGDIMAQIKTQGVTCTCKTGTLVGTGSVLQLKNGETVVAELTVIVLGDASGDGQINSQDYLMLKRHFLGTYTLKDEYLRAADLDGNGSISSAEYLKVKRHFLGTYDIFAEQAE